MTATPKNLFEIAQGPLPETSLEQVGNKAWNLMRMAAAGLPVPAAFVLPTAWCRRAGAETELPGALADGMARLEARTGLGFGAARKPLLVSVRSGSAASMPGMMETVLDVGLNPDAVDGLIRMTGNPRLGWDCYRRLIQGYAEVVQGLPAETFDELVTQAIARDEVESERDLDFRSLRQLTRDMTARFHELTGEAFPVDPMEQLEKAAAAVFRSWDAPKAAAYRRLNKIDDAAGTAVTVERMVFGNAGGNSGSGVGFTRNPATGEHELYLDFRFNGQGEDVVAGRRRTSDHERLRRILPEIWRQIEAMSGTLENLFGDAQDFEFTVEDGALWLLQARSAKRTPWAAVKIAVDLVEEGLIEPKAALRRLEGIDLRRVARTRFEVNGAQPLARAQAASIGVASGPIALDAAGAMRLENPILVRRDMATADIEGIARAVGVLTATGSRTSHAAVVARQLGKVCVVGCADLEVDPVRAACRIHGKSLVEGDVISLDGNDGCIYAGKLEMVTERPERELASIAQWKSGRAPRLAGTNASITNP
ncbi:MAG TPA: PEP/pyruvate-binding domain-containing protein [Bryobacteraceae bacterium]|nr:PEP/pyruvate-binding domain-containing protein [Bryobacteraceae bacterium]